MAPRRARARLTAFGLAAAILLSACGDAFHPAAATVNGSRITDDELERAIPLMRLLSALKGDPACGVQAVRERPAAACARATLTQLIQDRVVAPFAREHGVRVSDKDLDGVIAQFRDDPRVVEAQQHGVTLARFRPFLRSYLVFVQAQPEIAGTVASDAELRATYEQNLTAFTTVHLAVITVGTQEEAQRIADQATAENFADLAKRFSTDATTKDKGGDIGEVPATQLPPEMVNLALQLSDGEIGGPVQSQFGWHVIRLLEKKVTPFDEARDQVLQLVGPRVFAKWLRRELADADVEVNPRYGRFDPRTDQVVPVCSTATAPPADECLPPPAPLSS